MQAAMLLVLMCAQEAAAPPAETNQLQRIRKALEQPAPPSLVAPALVREGPVFRARIEAFDLGPAWKDRSVVPPYVRTWFRPYHHEFLERVTPEEFRGATLAPYGIAFDQLAGYLVKEIKAARRASQEKRARDVVARELAIFLACRADPSKPDS
jgi:hypothetical protein